MAFNGVGGVFNIKAHKSHPNYGMAFNIVPVHFQMEGLTKLKYNGDFKCTSSKCNGSKSSI